MCHEVPRKLRCATFTRTLNIRHSKKWAENLYDQSKVQQWMFRHIGSAVTASSSAMWWKKVGSPLMRERKNHHSSVGCDAMRQGLAIIFISNSYSTFNRRQECQRSHSNQEERRRKFTKSAENRGKANAARSRWEFMLLRNICSSPVAEGEDEEEEKLRILIIFLGTAFSLFGFGTL